MPGRRGRARISFVTLFLILGSMVAMASAFFESPSSRNAELARLRDLAESRRLLRGWIEEQAELDGFGSGLRGEAELLAGPTPRHVRWDARPRPFGMLLDLQIADEEHQHGFVAELRRGSMAETMGWGLGLGAEFPLGLRLQTDLPIGRFDAERPHPLDREGVWPTHFDLAVPGSAGTRLSHYVRRADELPLRYLGRSSLAADYLLHPRARQPLLHLMASDEREQRVRIEGNLWLGVPGQKLVLDLGGRRLLLYVEGDVFVAAELELQGPLDELVVVSRDPLGGDATLYFGLPGRSSNMSIEGRFLVRGDLRLGAASVQLMGQALVEGSLRCLEGQELRIESLRAQRELREPIGLFPPLPDSTRKLRLEALEAQGGR